MPERPGFIYIFTEASPEEISALRKTNSTPSTYKIGKACWGKATTSKTYFGPVETRQSKAQSCNPRPVNCLRLFSFQDEKLVLTVEKSFHKQHQRKHGILLYPAHEWYRSTLSIPECASWLIANGGEDVTERYDVQTLPGAYEEGPYEKSSKSEFVQPFILYLLGLEDEGSWYRILATAYDRKDVPRWYNTGNPREVTLQLKLMPRQGESPESRNELVREFMREMLTEFGNSQSAVARKPGAAWNTLAWVKSPQVYERFVSLAKSYRLWNIGN
jgi:hypothetical protein